MNAGELRHRIVIQRQEDTGRTDGEGNRIRATYPVMTAMAAVKDVSGREFFEAAAHQMEHVVTFTIRWRDGLRNDMEILFGDTVYEIIQINHLGYRRDWIQIKARVRMPEESEGSAHGFF
ncbi:MAG: phage head closure protein [Clostridiales bacterium]|nr:phage head closure protein [Clostridiales bacterium]